MPALTQILIPLGLFFNLAAIGPLRNISKAWAACSMLIASVLYGAAAVAAFLV